MIRPETKVHLVPPELMKIDGFHLTHESNAPRDAMSLGQMNTEK